jgi:hypothetical protein
MANDEQMLKDHQATWKGFTRVAVLSLSFVVIVLLLMRCALV